MDYSNDEIIHIKKGKIEYLKFRILEKYNDRINHVITLRHGGVSPFPYDSLNFRIIGNDKKENIEKNLELICDKINLNSNDVFKARQNHTDNILLLSNENKEKYMFSKECKEEYDAYITNEKNIASLVTTADCNPIIIYDPVKNVVSNVHSGWKGTIQKIYLKAIDKMVEEYNCDIKDLIFCIGPSIKKCCFTSKEEEFKKKFTDIWNYDNQYISYDEDNERFHIDLSYVIKKDIIEKGIKEENISICNICTMCNYEDFFSYRIATKNKYTDFGTFATIVYLK